MIFSYTSHYKDDHEIFYSPPMDHGGVTQVLISSMRRDGELKRVNVALVLSNVSDI